MNGTQVVVQTDLLEAAGNMLSYHDAKDLLRPGMLELMGQDGIATLSGLNDYDYQDLNIYAPGNKPVLQIRTLDKSTIPNEILEHFKHIKCHCTMGLFPEIGRAWLTIDSEIYIWTFEHTRDVAYYDGLSQLIISVGLVKPRAGVFVKDVKYLLLLTTPTEIIVLGVTFGNPSNKVTGTEERLDNEKNQDEMQLMNKPIFVISTDNVSISVIKGSADGRIFMGGRDGCLYEIFYQAESSWFGKRCRKINLSQSIVSYMMPNFLKVFSETDPIESITIDNSRNLLYLLTEKGSIEAWNMGTDYTSVHRISRITQNEIVQCATNIVRTVDCAIFKNIKALCPINANECSGLHVLAITESGVRLYFSISTPNLQKSNTEPPQHEQGMQQQQGQHISSSPQQQVVSRSQPSFQPKFPSVIQKTTGLFLYHVRLPPGYTPNTTINKPRQVHTAYYDDGVLLMVATQQQDQDVLWSISSAPFLKKTYLVESTTADTLNGIVWSMAELSNQYHSGNRLALHNAREPKRVAVLTNQGTHIMNILKPTDLLSQLLIACNGAHHEDVKIFFQKQTEVEACITCLLIATSDEYRGTELAAWAVQAFMLYGGEPSIVNQSSGMQPQITNNRYSLSNAVTQRTGTPSTPSNYENSPQTYTPFANMDSVVGHHQSGYGKIVSSENTGILYSAKHDGLYLYVARLIRSIWKTNCVDDKLCSILSTEECKLLLREFNALRSFLEVNSVHDFSSTNSTFNNESTRINGFYSLIHSKNNLTLKDKTNDTEQAHIEEKRSLTALIYFIKHCCEIISLWNILNEHQFQYIAAQLSEEQQNYLKSSTFRDLFLTRSEICYFLIIALIKTYLKDKACVSAISSTLREACPNLYRHEDAVTYKATEILMSAKTNSSTTERLQKLRVALQMCKDAAPTLPLHSICQQFIHAEFFEGVIELTATCATKSDPKELGIHYYKNDESSEDREGYAAFAARMSCYKEVRLMLDYVYQSLSNQSNYEKTQNSFYNNSILLENSQIEPDSANEQLMKVIMQALREKDPLLHITIYEWLLAHEMLCELLNIVEPTLGEFLRRNAARNPENLKLIDLLWKYYEKNGHHSQAARILNNLAVTRSNKINLDQRIEYLVRAVMCMRNEIVGSSINNGVFLKELEDKLDIARVQKTVLNNIILINPKNHEAVTAIQELNCQLFDITQLYQDFTEPFQLWECQLTILNCSHHNDPLLIESVWSRLISKAIEGNGSNYEKSVRLFTKIEKLVREFGESGHCFPLAFLIRELEIRACQMKLDDGIVAEKFVAMNIDIELIMEYYSRMISINERIWTNEGDEWHLVKSAIRVVTLLANNVQTIYYRSKRRIIGKAQDIISVCLNICYQKPNTEHLQQLLKELQCRLHRLIS